MLRRSRWAISKLINGGFSLESPAVASGTVGINLIDHLRMTAKETERICENIESVCSNPMHVLAHPESHLRFSKNLKVMMGLGLDAYEMKRVLTGTQALLVNEADETEQKLRWLSEEIGLSNAEIRKILVKLPKVCGFRMEGDMSKMFADLAKAGIDAATYKSMIVNCPGLLGCDLERNMVEFVLLLDKYGISAESAFRLLKNRPQFGTYNMEKVELMLNWLGSMGVSTQLFESVLKRSPELFAVNGIEKAELKIKWMEENLHMEREIVVDRVLVKAPAVFAKITINILNSRLKNFKDMGLTDEDCRTMVLRLPSVFTRRSGSLIHKIKFAREVLGKPISSIANYPMYLTCAMSNRILFRAALLDYKNEDYKAKKLRAYVSYDDYRFFRPIAHSEISEFRSWWEPLTDQEKLDAFKYKLYFQDMHSSSPRSGLRLKSTV